MSKPTVPRGKVVPLHPESAHLTLADVTITWGDGDETMTAKGAQVAALLTLATEETPRAPALISLDAGICVPLLRGLADLTFPDARSLNDLGEDARFFISESMRRLAAIVGATELDHVDLPRRFVVLVKPGSGLRSQVTPEASR